MKITKILPKFLAKSYQEEDLRRAEIQLQYHKGMARVFEQSHRRKRRTRKTKEKK